MRLCGGIGCWGCFVLCAVIGRDRNNEISKACFFETSELSIFETTPKLSFWNSNQDRPTFAAGHQCNPLTASLGLEIRNEGEEEEKEEREREREGRDKGEGGGYVRAHTLTVCIVVTWKGREGGAKTQARVRVWRVRKKQLEVHRQGMTPPPPPPHTPPGTSEQEDKKREQCALDTTAPRG
jgi:hypothetical protein